MNDCLAHAGRHLEMGEVILVLAAPGDEEMVLHEEAEYAAHRELVGTLPLAVPLSEPRVIAQRHRVAVARPGPTRAFDTQCVKATLSEVVGAPPVPRTQPRDQGS